MFWRRKKSDASKDGGQQQHEKEEDEIVKLQRQFGIKPVSDADVQAEFHKLFGGGGSAAGATGLSPTSELLLLGGGAADDDDEASILRALNLNGTSIDKIDIDGLDLSDDEADGDDSDAKRELGGVLREVHTTAAHYQSQNDPMQLYAGGGQTHTTTAGVGAGGLNREQVTARVQELKRQAITLKREGKVKDALALFRQAKEFEAKLEVSDSVSAQYTVSAQQQRQVVVAPTAAVERIQEAYHYEDGHDSDVEVTEDDMQDPEFLAQLAKMGLPVDAYTHHQQKSPVVETVASIEAHIQDAKLKAIECKRNNQIQDALQWMRKIKELEAKVAQHKTVVHGSAATVVTSTVIQKGVTTETTTSRRAPAGDRVETSHAYTSAPMSVERYKEEDNDEGNFSDVEVTENDMENAAFAEELLKLGFSPTDANSHAEGDGGGHHSSPALIVSSSGVTTNKESAASAPESSGRPPVFQTSFSIGDEDLIDAFDEDDEDDYSSTMPAYSASASARVGYGTLSATEVPVAHIYDPPQQQDQHDQVELVDLQTQLQNTKETAIRLKREGNVKEALEAMRRVKQIETLVEHKQKKLDLQASLGPPPSTIIAQEPVMAAKFHELEQLLVDFGNRALALAKENLSVDRATATEWLNKVRMALYDGNWCWCGSKTETCVLFLTRCCFDNIAAERIRCRARQAAREATESAAAAASLQGREGHARGRGGALGRPCRSSVRDNPLGQRPASHGRTRRACEVLSQLPIGDTTRRQDEHCEDFLECTALDGQNRAAEPVSLPRTAIPWHAALDGDQESAL